MRKLFPLLFVVLLPATAAAQGTPPELGATRRTPPDLGAIKQAPPLTKHISRHQAVTNALDRVRSDLASGQLAAWGAGTGGGIRAATVASAGASFNRTGGRAVYVVGVTAANARGHVRVIVDAVSGQVLSTRIGSWDWGASPDWWLKGENAAPAPR